MRKSVEGLQSTFVVRFWREWQEKESDQVLRWHGRVEHLQSGEWATFNEKDQLVAFIGRFIQPWSSLPYEK